MNSQMSLGIQQSATENISLGTWEKLKSVFCQLFLFFSPDKKSRVQIYSRPYSGLLFGTKMVLIMLIWKLDENADRRNTLDVLFKVIGCSLRPALCPEKGESSDFQPDVDQKNFI